MQRIFSSARAAQLGVMIALPLFLWLGVSTGFAGEEAPTTGKSATVEVAQITPTITISITVIVPSETPGTPVTPPATPLPTATQPATPTVPATETPPLTPTQPSTPTVPATETPLPTTTATATPIPTVTATVTPLPTPSATATMAPTVTFTATPLPTATQTTAPTPTSTATPGATATWTATPTLAPTATSSPAATATITATRPLTGTPTLITTPPVTRTPNATPVPTATAVVSATATMTPTRAGGQAGTTTTVARPGGVLPGNPAISLVKVAEGLADPVTVAAAPDGSGRLFIVERVGRIRIVQNGELLETPFLDINDLVRYDHLEQGLLGLAFHPNYAENGRFFIYYTDWLTNGDAFLVEYHVSDDPNQADPASARVLLTHDQPYINHAGGTLRFGPDGYLYVAMGDGGLAGDPYRNAQDLSNLLGKIVRINVEVDDGRAYRIPADNPFLGQVLASPVAQQAAQNGRYLPATRPEIWAYGLSNPWQFSFDAATGDLYLPDRGQNSWEEINFQPAGSTGGWDYGWPLLEAAHCYPLEGYPAESGCGMPGVLPVAEYEHSQENCAITGIGVYRGQAFPSLNGIYFSADRCSGTFWGLTRTESGAWAFAELGGTDLQVSGAGVDEAGELYVTACTCEDERGYDPQANPGGSVWRLVAVE